MLERIVTTQQSSPDELKNVEARRLEHQNEVPEWHKEILDARQRAFKEGRINVLDWEEAKRQIEKAIR